MNARRRVLRAAAAIAVPACAALSACAGAPPHDATAPTVSPAPPAATTASAAAPVPPASPAPSAEPQAPQPPEGPAAQATGDERRHAVLAILRGEVPGLATLPEASSDGFGVCHYPAPRQRPTNVVVEAPSIRGKLDAAQTADALQRRLGHFLMCYERGADGDPKPTGTLTVTMKVDANGRAVATGKADGTFPSKEVVTCVREKVVPGLVLPLSPAGSAPSEVTVRVSFTPWQRPRVKARPADTDSGAAPSATPGSPPAGETK